MCNNHKRLQLSARDLVRPFASKARRKLTLIATGVAIGVAPITAGDLEPRFPGAAWETRTPEQLGLDGEKLAQIEALLGGDGCVVFDGYLVQQWGQTDAPGEWASASKPVITTLLMFAVHEGLLDSVDERIVETGWPMIDEDQPITYRSLANMTSGYMREEPHQAAWAYNDYGFQLLVKTLFERIYGADPETVANAGTRLGALQFQDGGLFRSGDDHVVASVRDFARVAWLWLHRGQWDGVQLLPHTLFDSQRVPQVPAELPLTAAEHPLGDYLRVGTYGGSTDQTPYGPGTYGFGWWFNGLGPLHPDARTWPDAPADTFQANGSWGLKVATVIPSLRVVLIHRDSDAGFAPGAASASQNLVLKLLVEALRPRPWLTLDKTASGVVLDWTDDCSSDHAVYEGEIGQWYSHLPLRCTDAGSDRTELLPHAAGDRYYLVVPRDAAVEGSYGRDSFDAQLPASAAACVTSQDVGFCP